MGDLKIKRTMAVLDPETKKPIFNVDLTTWTKFMREPKLRRVAETTLGDIWISTVFTGYSIDQKHFFETVVFGFSDNLSERYETWDDALTGHYRMVDKVKDLTKDLNG